MEVRWGVLADMARYLFSLRGKSDGERYVKGDGNIYVTIIDRA